MVDPLDDATGITALLGPTNTGKTHRALEQMLLHDSGMIGLPLRLLAREIYDRLTASLGERAVALVTGEEKRVPASPRFWICTVEAMPLDISVDFIAVDEIQLCAHPERGHVFTDRLLQARGRKETWFLGAQTIEPLIRRLVPAARVRSHPRLSQLHHAPPFKLNSLPKRTAVVAFSASRIYELGERIRHKHGGAALVLGALSPRTRNAQVALYQSGEVSHIVATDAIGMGLNLDISQVVFADRTKFDGRETRPLDDAELSQIAGRAGRYTNDGSFGVLAPQPDFSPKVVRALELHQFPIHRQISYRNSKLDLSSLDALLATLSEPPYRGELRAILPAEDHRALLALGRRSEVADLVKDARLLPLLWEVCQIPDYRQLLFEIHVRLLEELFLQLAVPPCIIRADFILEHLGRIAQPSSDIDTLMGKIAAIRTWNYVAQRRSWLPDGIDLEHRARDIEDRLSDALHEALLARFVERKRTYPRLPPTPAKPGKSGTKDHPFSTLMGLYVARQAAGSDPAPERSPIDALVDAAHEELSLDCTGRLWFQAKIVGSLSAGVDLLRPEVKVHLEPDPGLGARARIHRRLQAFVRDALGQFLSQFSTQSAEPFTPAARGLIYQLEQGLGCIARVTCAEQLEQISPRDRQRLGSLGLRFGETHVYLRRVLAGPNLSLKLALSSAFFRAFPLPVEQLLHKKSAPLSWHKSQSPFPLSTGFVPAGGTLLRIDVHDRLSSELRAHSRRGEFFLPRDLSARLECDESQLPGIALSMGYARRPSGKYRPITWVGPSRKRQRPTQGSPGNREGSPHSAVEESSES